MILGNKYFDTFKFSKAIENYDKVIKNTPTAEAHFKKGICLFALNNFENSLNEFKLSQIIDKNYGKLTESLIGASLVLNNLILYGEVGESIFIEAEEHCDNGIKLSNNDAQAYYLKSLLYIDAELKLKYLNLAIEKNPFFIGAYMAKARTLSNEGNTIEANNVIDKILEYKDEPDISKGLLMKVTFIPIYIDKVDYLLSLGDEENAIIKYNESTSRYINEYLQTKMGEMFFDYALYQVSIICFERALIIDPKAKDALYLLIKCFLELKLISKAISKTKYLLRIYPSCFNDLELAKIFIKIGLFNEFLENSQKFPTLAVEVIQIKKLSQYII